MSKEVENLLSEIPEIQSVEKITVKPGMALAVICKERVTESTASYIREVFERLLPGLKVIIFDRGVELKAIEIPE